MWAAPKWGAVGAIWSSFAGSAVPWLVRLRPPRRQQRLNDVKKQPSITADRRRRHACSQATCDLYGEFTHLDEMAEPSPAAVLATEDRRFHSHFGIDPSRPLRAVYVNVHLAETWFRAAARSPSSWRRTCS